ncbi:MAG: hypothetical protein ACLTBV_07220 [Enterocloster bolteae]
MDATQDGLQPRLPCQEETGDAPNLIYLPERSFHEEFLEDVKRLYDEKGGVVVVASEA